MKIYMSLYTHLRGNLKNIYWNRKCYEKRGGEKNVMFSTSFSESVRDA
jgi:hypothetical protein